jgi:predicted MFS family arabinose efflux permease
MILLAAFLFGVFIKSGKSPDNAGDASEEAPMEEGRQEPDGKNALFSLASISCYTLDFATCYGYYVLVTWLPNFLESERGFTGVAVGMSAALIAFSAIPGALFFGRKADRFRNRRDLLLCLLEITTAGIFLFIVMAPTPALLLAGLIAYGLIGKLTVEPILISYVIDHAPRGRTATHLTTFNFFGIASSIAAPLITGLLSDAFHSKVGGFYVAAALLVAATLFFFLVNKKRR